jgi:hypothetical protein
MKDVPEELNRIVDKVLTYRPKPKSKAAKSARERNSRKRSKQNPPDGGFLI